MKPEIITEEFLSGLRSAMRAELSEARLAHTFGVEREAVEICCVLCPEEIMRVRCAAILHDATKEYSYDKQLKICDEFGIMLREDEKNAPAVIHAITAAAVTARSYHEILDDGIIGAIRWHTTGHRGMTTFEKIICFADYIEDGRNYDVCRALHNEFWSDIEMASTDKEKLEALDRAVLKSLQNTVEHIKERRGSINRDTLEAIEYIKSELNEKI